MAHPIALPLRNLQTLLELGVDNNTTVVFPAPLMSAITDLSAFLTKEDASAKANRPAADLPEQRTPVPVVTGGNGG